MSYIKELLHVAEQQRLIISKRTKDSMAASKNKAGRKSGQLDKITNELPEDIVRYIADRSMKGSEHESTIYHETRSSTMWSVLEVHYRVLRKVRENLVFFCILLLVPYHKG